MKNEVDPLLWTMVQVAEGMAVSTEGVMEDKITLSAGGLLICGTVTSGQQFVLGNSGLDTVMEIIKRNSGAFGTADPAVEPAGVTARYLSENFLHLRGVAILVNDSARGPNVMRLPWWRCRLADVSGFAMGAFHSIQDT